MCILCNWCQIYCSKIPGTLIRRLSWFSYGEIRKMHWTSFTVHNPTLLTHLPSSAAYLYIYASVNWASIGSDNGLSPNHYPNQCSLIVNWAFSNKLQWNSNRNSSIFIQENSFENVVFERAAILSRGRWVKDPSLPIYREISSTFFFFFFTPLR